jgi:hypothetical protein
MAEIQIQSDNHIYYFKTFDDFEAHKDEILNNSQIFIGESSGGSSIGGTETLLWENLNPNQDFEAQSIQVNGLMEYDYLVITSKMLLGGTGANEYQNTTLIKVELSGGGAIVSSLFNVSPRCRNIVIEENNTIYLSDAFMESSNSIFNNHCIPLEIYGIKIDSSSSTQSNQNIYSTEETVIGKWIDGKSLYGKVINFTFGTSFNTWVKLNHNIENIESCFIRNAFLQDGTTLPDKWTQLVLSPSLIEYTLSSDAQYQNKVVTLCVVYTKTTD